MFKKMNDYIRFIIDWQVENNFGFIWVVRLCSNDNMIEKIVIGSKMIYKWMVKFVGLMFVIFIYEDFVVYSMLDLQKREMR